MMPKDPILARLDGAVEALAAQPTADHRTRAIAHLLLSIAALMSPTAAPGETTPKDARAADHPTRRRPAPGGSAADANGPHFPRLSAAIDAGVSRIELSAFADRAQAPERSPRRRALALPFALFGHPMGSLAVMRGRAGALIGVGLVLAITLVGAAAQREMAPEAMAVPEPNAVPSEHSTPAHPLATAGSVVDRKAPAITQRPARREPVTPPRPAAVSPAPSEVAGEDLRHVTTIGGASGIRVRLAAAAPPRTSTSQAAVTLAAVVGGRNSASSIDRYAAAPHQTAPSRPQSPAEPVAVVLAERTRLAEGEALYQRAYDLQRAGHGDQAIALYQQSAALDPWHAATHYDWGYLLQQQGDLPAAIDQYRRAIALDPNHVWAHYNMGWLLERSGDLAAAEPLYRRAIAIDSNHVNSLYNLANLLDRRGDTDEALDLYRRVLALDPKHRWATVDLRDLLARLAAAGSPQPGSGRS